MSIKPKSYCINCCKNEVYKDENGKYPLFCYDCQKKSDKEVMKIKPKLNTVNTEAKKKEKERNDNRKV